MSLDPNMYDVTLLDLFFLKSSLSVFFKLRNLECLTTETTKHLLRHNLKLKRHRKLVRNKSNEIITFEILFVNSIHLLSNKIRNTKRVNLRSLQCNGFPLKNATAR